MSEFRNIQALKILSAYTNAEIQKGGIGSGRKKSSLQRLEETNFSPEEEKEQRERADELEALNQQLQAGIKKLNEYKQIYKQAKLVQSSYEKAGMIHDPMYHKMKGRAERNERLGKELVPKLHELKKKFDELNY